MKPHKSLVCNLQDNRIAQCATVNKKTMQRTSRQDATVQTWSPQDLSDPRYARAASRYDALSTAVVDSELEQLLASLPSAPRMLEIGSGMGRALASSRYRGQIIQSDPDLEVVQMRQERGEAVVCADARNLAATFGEATFDIILGTNVLDTIAVADLSLALAGIHAALKYSGVLIHFLDMNAFHEPVFERFLHNDEVPFPANVDGRLGVLGLPRAALADSKRTALPLDEQFFLRWYAQDPLPLFNSFLTDTGMPMLARLARCAEAVRIHLGLPCEPADFDTVFGAHLSHALAKSGFTSLSQGRVRRSQTSVAAIGLDEPNHFVSKRGTSLERRDGALAPNTCYSEIEVCVHQGRKPGT